MIDESTEEAVVGLLVVVAAAAVAVVLVAAPGFGMWRMWEWSPNHTESFTGVVRLAYISLFNGLLFWAAIVMFAFVVIESRGAIEPVIDRLRRVGRWAQEVVR